MNNPKNIQDELRMLESDLPVNNVQPFSVPDGYFEGLATAILAKVKNTEVSAEEELNELSPLLAGLSKNTPYAVPSFYFQNSLEDLSALTNDNDIPSVLDSIGRNTPYMVPEGYFETLPAAVLAKVTKPKAKFVPLFAKTWMRVASAAAVIGALFFGGYQLLQSSNDDVKTTAVTQTTSNDQNLLANNTQPIEKEIKQVSTKELEDFIATVQTSSESIVENEKTTSDKTEVEELLKDVSTKEMESFLSAMPMIDEDLLTTN